jgi:riboflavin biosynthesis pyrimidine reductase
VAADAVLAGAGTVGRDVFFTVTHPEMVALRRDLGLPRHPIQMVLSKEGHLDLSARLFTMADVRVVILGGSKCCEVLTPRLRDRPWITLMPIGDSLAGAFATLRRDHGIGRISAVGGRHAATALVNAGIVQDIYLTTSPIIAGDPDTPWYAGGRPPELRTIVRKREVTPGLPISFGHFAITKS